jgi:hopanoid biosynthesis associated protein HpnK
MKSLVVTGDDFGSSSSVNHAIIAAHDHGILTSASLMVAGESAAEAVELARSRPNLAVGLHLVLVDGRAALPAREVPSLTDPDGRFRSSPFTAGWRYQFSRDARLDLEREIRAQLERFRETGLELSHVDGHHHLHLHPVVLDTLVRLAPEFGIRWIRVPRDELVSAVSRRPASAAAGVVWSVVFRALRSHAARRLRAAGIGFVDRVYGLLMTGRIDEPYLLGLFPRIDASAVELYCHPAWPGSGLGSGELAALVSDRVRGALPKHGLVLSRFASLPLPARSDAGARSG